MKKIISILVVTVLLAAAFATVAYAADTTNVIVTIWDGNGNAAVSHEAISVADFDSDGKISVNDVLASAHDKWYEGGANAGYLSETTEWGLSLMKLWGVENGGSYGYYVNNEMAMSLDDEVKDGDYVAAFVYVDVRTMSDTYAFVEILDADSSVGEFRISAKYSGWDEEWNPTVNAFSDGAVYIDGVDSGIKTDADGLASITISEPGEHIVIVKGDDRNYACAICRVIVDTPATNEVSESAEESSDAIGTSADTSADTTAVEDTTTESGVPSAAQTSDGFLFVTALLLTSAVCVVVTVKKEHNR